MNCKTKKAITNILNRIPIVQVLSCKQTEDTGADFHVTIYGEHEWLFFSEENGIISRDDFSGSVVWGRLEDGSFSDHATKAFLPNAKWLNEKG